MHRRDGQLIVSATDLVGFLECGHLTRLERAAVAGLISKPDRSEDPEVELLQRRGGAHEKRYIDELTENGRAITDLSAHKDESYESQASRTEDAMRRGDDVIYQATVFDGRWVGHPDFLLRVTARHLSEAVHSSLSQLGGSASRSPADPAALAPSLIPITDSTTSGRAGASATSGLGHEWIYEVADTKLAHSAKASALIQICSYVDQITRIQGVLPERVHVVTGGAAIGIHSFRSAEMMAYFRYARAHFEEAIDEAAAGPPIHPIPRETSYPDPVGHCAVCRWFPHNCRVQWRDDDALPRVAGISRTQRTLLTTNSVITMRALSELDQPIGFEGLKRGQAESLWRMREQARLQVATGESKVPVFELLNPEVDSEGSLVADRGLAALPLPSPGDLFFDIEGDNSTSDE